MYFAIAASIRSEANSKVLLQRHICAVVHVKNCTRKGGKSPSVEIDPKGPFRKCMTAGSNFSAYSKYKAYVVLNIIKNFFAAVRQYIVQCK